MNRRSANGVVILVLGILSLIGFGILTGLPAWIMGNQSLKDIESGSADSGELTMVQVGRVIGMVSTILTVVGLCIGLMIFFGFFAMFGIALGTSR